MGKKITSFVLGLVAIGLLSACNIELQIPITAIELQEYTISGLPQLNNSNFAARLIVDDVLEFAINDVIVHIAQSDSNQQIAPFVFEAYPGDKITIQGINLNSLTGCSIGDVYLLTSSTSYQLSEAESRLFCSHEQIFYTMEYTLPSN